MIDFDLTDDFATVVDFLEAVTLEPADESESVVISSARRLELIAAETTPSNGAAIAADARWRFQLPSSADQPTLGDAIVDTLSHRWTILKTRRLDTIGLWECETRELRIAAGLSDRVDIERAVWVDNDGEMEISEWTTIATAVPVRIQPIETIVDRTATPPTSTTRLQVLFGGTITLEPEDRFVGEDDTIYWVEKLEQSERIDVLPVVTVLREES